MKPCAKWCKSWWLSTKTIWYLIHNQHPKAKGCWQRTGTVLFPRGKIHKHGATMCNYVQLAILCWGIYRPPGTSMVNVEAANISTYKQMQIVVFCSNSVPGKFGQTDFLGMWHGLPIPRALLSFANAIWRITLRLLKLRSLCTLHIAADNKSTNLHLPLLLSASICFYLLLLLFSNTSGFLPLSHLTGASRPPPARPDPGEGSVEVWQSFHKSPWYTTDHHGAPHLCTIHANIFAVRTVLKAEPTKPVNCNLNIWLTLTNIDYVRSIILFLQVV